MAQLTNDLIREGSVQDRNGFLVQQLQVARETVTYFVKVIEKSGREGDVYVADLPGSWNELWQQCFEASCDGLAVFEYAPENQRDELDREIVCLLEEGIGHLNGIDGIERAHRGVVAGLKRFVKRAGDYLRRTGEIDSTSVESRLIARWLDNQDWSIAQICEVEGVSRSQAYRDYPRFIELARPRKRATRLGFVDHRTGNVDAAAD